MYPSVQGEGEGEGWGESEGRERESFLPDFLDITIEKQARSNYHPV